MRIVLTGVRKQYGGLRPLRVNSFVLEPEQRVSLRGLDAAAAEMFCLLLTGAAVPDEGTVVVDGHDTQAIATDTQWLHSLDRFGLVSHRAVLLDPLTVEANLALPLTLSIDPIPEEIRRAVALLADEVGLGRERLSASVQSLSAVDRVRVHLARALATDPKILLLEHVTAPLAPGDAAMLGGMLPAIGDDRRISWIALSEDEHFIGPLGGTAWRLDPGSGAVAAGDDTVRQW